MRTTLRSTLIASCSLIAAMTMAQPQWSASLPPVANDGYYTIVLSPEVVGRSRSDMSDLRVMDPLGHEVPYVLEQEPAMYEHTWMRTYKLLRNERVEKRTVIEMEADSATIVDELQVHIRNAMVNKSARITGSDDRIDWYMIKDECLSVGEGDGTTSVLRFVDLPLSNYRYYRIELNDKRTAPVQVLDLGHSGRARSEGRYTSIDGLRFVRAEDRRTTRIALFGASPFRADRVSLDIRNDGPYMRQGAFARRSVYTTTERRRTVQRISEEGLGGFLLASFGRGTVQGPGAITDTLWISIENQSDRPLDITGIRAFQLEHRLVARLKSGEHYSITTGDPKASSPHYDLAHFRDSIPPSIAVLAVPALITAPPTQQAEPFFSPGASWLWAVLVALGAIIAFSAVRLLRRTANTK